MVRLRNTAAPGRLRTPHVRPWSTSWLVYRALGQALAAGVAQARSRLGLRRGLALDVGCGHRPWRDLLVDMDCLALDATTVDASPQVVADAAALPVTDARADLVFCSQVLEHVEDAGRVLLEFSRVLRDGGQLVLSVPFYWPLHEEPFDYRRFTSHGLRLELARAGFDDIDIEADCATLTVVVVASFGLLPDRRLPRLPWLPLVLLANLLAPWAQRLSADRRSTLNWVVRATRQARPTAPAPER